MPSLSNHQSNELSREYLEDYFGYYITETATGCWLWEGPKTSNGYPRIKHQLIHSTILRMKVGELQTGFEACHKCCTKLCVNPEHLYAGTRKQNVSDPDMQAVYRRKRKLDEQDYETICTLFSWGWPKEAIGRVVGVCGGHINKFLKGGLKNAKPC